MDAKVAPAAPQVDNDNQKQQTIPEQQNKQQQQQQQQQQWQQLLQPALQSASHSSLSSVESIEFVPIDGSPMMRKRRSQLETLGRIIFLLSVVFLIVGIITTVFGFANINLTRSQQLPMQIAGPACLVVTAAMWLIGLTFCRLWKAEIRRQKQAMELRTRVQLHALAMDLLKKPVVLSPRALQDPRLRRQLLIKLRQQNALDASSIDTMSRRSSRAPSIDMRRRQKSNSIISSFLKNGAADHRKSTDTCTSGRVIFPPPQFDLPGIHISRIETIDYDDSSVFSGSGQIGTTRFIVIHSDGSSDFSRLSFPNSECSLSAGSRSSRSRSSKDSSNVSSRLWDFSPRESDWDVNVPLSSGGGGGGSGGNSHRNDLPGGARDYSMLSPSMPRKGSVVTFDISEPTVRRHSSPASSVRRKDSVNMGAAGECPCCRPDYPSSSTASKDERSSAAVYRKKSSGDQSLMSITIDENDGDEDDEDDDDGCDAETRPLNPDDANTATEAVVTPSDQPSIPERSGFHPAASAAAAPGGRQPSTALSSSAVPPPPRSGARPSLRRHNTDDSEIERRMAKIFHEINYSLTDSLEETKYQSPEGVAEAETQTMSEQEIEALLEHFDGGGGGAKKSDEKLAQSDRDDRAEGNDPTAEFINFSETPRGEGDQGRPAAAAEKRSKLSLLTAALFPGRNRKSSSTKGEEATRPNRRRGVLLMLGLTE